jgi:hypothetical protein
MLDRLPTGSRRHSGGPSVLFFNASTETRTQNTPLEAEHDFHFTTEAQSGRPGIRTLISCKGEPR